MAGRFLSQICPKIRHLYIVNRPAETLTSISLAGHLVNNSHSEGREFETPEYK
jgi:hypothetical protein